MAGPKSDITVTVEKPADEKKKLRLVKLLSPKAGQVTAAKQFIEKVKEDYPVRTLTSSFLAMHASVASYAAT